MKGAKAPAAKKETKKGEAEKVEEVKITSFPKSVDHHMEEITSFLKRLEGDVVNHEYAAH